MEATIGVVVGGVVTLATSWLMGRQAAKYLEQNRPATLSGGGSRSSCGGEAAIELQAKVLRAIETQGWFEAEARPEVLVGDLEAAARAWLRQKAARGCSDGTIKRYGTSLGQWFKFLHQRAGASVPVTVLTRDLFADAILAWRADKLSDSTIYNNARVAVELWDWAFDDPAAFPGVPMPPRDKKALLPKAAVCTRRRSRRRWRSSTRACGCSTAGRTRQRGRGW